MTKVIQPIHPFNMIKAQKHGLYDCNKCKVEKELSENNYHKDTRYPVKNFRKTCKQCIHERQRQKRETKEMYRYY